MVSEYDMFFMQNGFVINPEGPRPNWSLVGKKFVLTVIDKMYDGPSRFLGEVHSIENGITSAGALQFSRPTAEAACGYGLVMFDRCENGFQKELKESIQPPIS